jgi:hypothetical protein
MDQITEALESYKSAIADNYSSYISNVFNRMVEQFGASLKGAGNDWKYAKVYRETIRPNLRINPEFVKNGTAKLNAPYEIDEHKLSKNAQNYAVATVEYWKDKIKAKLVNLDMVNVRRLDGISFVITGTNKLGTIAIEQNMIVNVSSKGTLFNQFPSRIYVNGKFMSEAAYKKATA